MSEPPIHQESVTGAAIDGARIATMTAAVLLELDPTLSEAQAANILTCLNQARQWLDEARALYPQPNPSSVHVVSTGAANGGIIIP